MSASPRSPRTSTRSASLPARPISCIGGDLVVAGTKKVLAAVKHGATQIVVNTAEFLPGDFTRNADFSLPSERLKRTITADAGADHSHFVDATRVSPTRCSAIDRRQYVHARLCLSARRLPLSAASIEKAIELNGEAVAMNHAAFHWGRRAVTDRAAVEALAKPASSSASDAERLSESISTRSSRGVKHFSTAYQNAAYARRYRTWVDKVIRSRDDARSRQKRSRRRGRALSVQADGL